MLVKELVGKEEKCVLTSRQDAGLSTGMHEYLR
jgi:hypothetical protein